ncbi:hypothetical protein CEP52_003989 [Fusarium oligoseptatum]|uniref:AMP-dependent synthetase/ligase domain-containing protein n=1 Tax=Fusarium oligoseptatum TaxID=2604345 RepID=A0A428U5V8_9HYPO|nr:hypothetical protein CEP52_003989 [Fusarium oligoseptatum]
MTQTEYGRRLLPSLVDEIAISDPDRVLYSIMKTNNPADGFQDINVKTFARAVNRCAWYIEKHLGRGQNFPTLAFIGPQDVVYAILTLACVKTGYKINLLSPRNTLEASLFLLEETDCKTFLVPPKFPLPIIGQLVEARRMEVLEMPALQHWLEDGPVELYPYTKTFEEARSEPFVVLHTSGSTGMPKPLMQTHGTIATLDASAQLSSLGYPDNYLSNCVGSRVYLAFPLCHCAGLWILLPGCVYAGYTVVLGPFPLSAETANAIHVHGNVQQSAHIPFILSDLVKNPEYLDNLGRLDRVIFGGGSLPKVVGDAIVTKTKLLNCIGTTEGGALLSHNLEKEDWQYVNYSHVVGSEFRQVSDDLYEHFIVRDPKLDLYQSFFQTFPDLDEWPMKDLYSKHPTKEGLWLYRGRTDDVIVFSSGANLNPIDMESVIDSNPAVRAALVIGTGYPRSGLLVEAVNPPKSEEEKKKLVDTIWPSVEAANKPIALSRRIHRDMIIFTSADKPMLRAGKGTVQRKLTVDEYSAEIEALYKATESLGVGFTSDWVRQEQ